MDNGGAPLPRMAPEIDRPLSMPAITAVVPAFNEERRILRVVDAIKQSEAVGEIVVVSDGSTDRTYECVKGDPAVRAIRLSRNLGKAGAMHVGAVTARSDWLLFLDADLIGLMPHHIHRMIDPVASGEFDMSVGVFHGGRWLTDLSQRLAPSISGQRVLHREFFLSIPDVRELRYGIEVAIGAHARRHDLRIATVSLPGVTHPMKEEKFGPLRGGLSRLRMYCEMGRYLYHTRGSRSADKAANIGR